MNLTESLIVLSSQLYLYLYIFQRGQFVSCLGLDGWLLANISAGMSPATSVIDVITQVPWLVQYFMEGSLVLFNKEEDLTISHSSLIMVLSIFFFS